MEQIFSELEQFGLKKINIDELKIDYKYLILGFKNIECYEEELIKFSEKINNYVRLIDFKPKKSVFTYVKYVGTYKGIVKKYKGGMNSNSENYSDTEYEFISTDNIFIRNDKYYILDQDFMKIGAIKKNKIFFFEVDNSFSEINFLNLILSIFSNIESERNKFIKVTCSNKNITIETTYNEIPSDYDILLEYKNNKNYSLENDFIFFK